MLQACVWVVALWTGPVVAGEPAPPHESLRLQSSVLQETRRINVYLPPGYDRCRDVRYPVLYMPDGGIAEDFPHVATTVDTLVRSGGIEPVIVVGVENTVRRRDMTGPTEIADDLRVTDQPGGAERFRRFFASELQPTMRARYRTEPRTAIIGESLAGLFIVETFLHAPRLFNSYIAIDPSLWWNAERLVRDAPKRLAVPDRPARSLLLTAGGRESNAEPVERLVSVLEREKPAGLHWQYLPRPDLRHDTIYRGTEEALLRLTFRVPPASTACGDEGRSAQGGLAPALGPHRDSAR